MTTIEKIEKEVLEEACKRIFEEIKGTIAEEHYKKIIQFTIKKTAIEIFNDIEKEFKKPIELTFYRRGKKPSFRTIKRTLLPSWFEHLKQKWEVK